MFKRLLFVFVILLPTAVFSQKEAKNYAQKNIVPIYSISPDSIDFSDLDVVGKAIGDARIVMIGEQDHGDGATMLAKTRLVKYLHEKKGFNVLAFEGDFSALNAGWEQTPKQPVATQNFFKNNLHSVWSYCTECKHLLSSYIPETYKTTNPIKVTGFDSQVWFIYSRAYLKDTIDQYLQRRSINFIHNRQYKEEFLPILFKLQNKWTKEDKENKVWLKAFPAMADTILAQLGSNSINDFAYRILENTRELAKQLYVHENIIQTYSIRDNQMAKNLQWLTDIKYPQEKIIVWAANGHIMKNTDTAFNGGHQFMKIGWMGTIYNQNNRNAQQTYIIGFASKGEYRRVGALKTSIVQNPIKKGFESWVSDDLMYGFLDWKPFRQTHPNYNKMFLMKGMGHYYAAGAWTNIFDGVFYLRDMEPCGTVQ